MTVNANGIPAELKIYKQWVNWKYEQEEGKEKPTKVPYSPKSRTRASSMNRLHWGTLDEALANVGTHFDGIGFVLTADDPYCIVDLDTPKTQEEWDLINETYQSLQSFTEISPSGTGMHVIVKAELGKGRKRHPIEVYDRARFMTFTGNVHFNSPINYRQREIEAIISAMPQDAEIYSQHDGLAAPSGTDREVWDRAASAANGEKFKALWNGDFKSYYSSQSEADFALVDIIAFYTQNAEQIKNLFRMSGLGQREKAKRDAYLDPMIRKSFDNIPPPVNMTHVADMVKTMMERQEQEKQAAADAAAAQPTHVQTTVFDESAVTFASPVRTEQPVTAANVALTPVVEAAATSSYTEADTQLSVNRLTFPDGLVGDIAQYIYDSSPRPVMEISLAAAFGLMAGICGGAFNVSNTGLNMYIVVLAQTGTGKEALQSGISRLMENVRAVTPSAINYIGASEFASPQALITHMQKKSKNFVSVIGECGMWLKTLSDPRAHERHSGLRRLLLDLYGKSGQRSVFHPTAYADSAKNTEAVRQPAVTLLGESTQTKFFECIDETLIAEGFVPRWLIIEYDGGRVPANRNHAQVYPSPTLMGNVSALCNVASQLIESLQTVHIPYSARVAELEHEFDLYCDEQINQTNEEALRNLWSRVHLKVLKVAGLVAVGRNIGSPIIDEYCFMYAKNLVLKDTFRMCKRYNSGQLAARVEASNSEQGQLVFEAVRRYFQMDGKTRRTYGITDLMFQNMAVPYVYFQRRLGSKAAFKKDRRGSAVAIQKAIEECCNTGLLLSIPATQATTMLRTSGKVWQIADYLQLEHESDNDSVV